MRAATLAAEIALSNIPESAVDLIELDVEVKLVDEMAAGVVAVPVSALVATGDGGYAVEAVTDDGGTRVQYDLAIELVAPLPGFVKRRAERRILNAIKEMKTFAEA